MDVAVYEPKKKKYIEGEINRHRQLTNNNKITNEVMLIKTRIFCKSSSTIFDRAYIWFFTWMNSYMIFIICCARKCFAAFRLCTFIWTFAGMRSHVNLIYIQNIISSIIVILLLFYLFVCLFFLIILYYFKIFSYFPNITRSKRTTATIERT